MKDVDFLLVGNKSDLECKVNYEEIINFVEEELTPDYVDENQNPIKLFRLPKKYFTCSVLTGEGVEEIMQYIAEVISKDPPTVKPSGGKPTIKLGEEKAEDKSCCS